MKVNILELKEAISESKSKSDTIKKLNYCQNGRTNRELSDLIKKYNIDISHFDNGVSKRQLYPTIEKICPICKKSFFTKFGDPKEKITCSYSCANTYFRSGINHPNWKDEDYRTTCFTQHKYKCVICKEKNIIEVHHFDGNKKNNNIENLIPLCPTHHKYCHSKYKYLIIDKITEYIKNFKLGM